MGANAQEALIFVVKIVFNLYLGAVLLRILLQLVRADFFNPISQLVWKITQPVCGPMQRALPRYRRFDTAGGVYLLVLCFIFVELVLWLYGFGVTIPQALTLTLLKVVALVLSLYTLTVFAQAILSWVGPGVSNPAANVLWSLNEPLLRPIRQVVPMIANIDLSPLVLIVLLQVANIFVNLPRYLY